MLIYVQIVIIDGKVFVQCTISAYKMTLLIFSFWNQGMDKMMETAVTHTHLFINTELDHHLPVKQLLSLL